MSDKKLILLSYYWPPAGGVAVRRWLMMSHHLAEMNWEIVVVTSANPDYPQVDEQLSEWIHPALTVIRISGFEPRNFLRKVAQLFSKTKEVNLDNTLNQANTKKSLAHSVLLWIRSNLFIPDARVGWARSVIKNLPAQLQSNRPDCIISTGPPHSTHLAAMALAEKYNTKWVADFRDPWTEIEYFDQLSLTKQARKSHSSLEKMVLTKADLITTVSPSWAKLFESKGAQKTAVIYNGFDELFHEHHEKVPENDTFSICHVGTMGPDRLVSAFYESILSLKVKNREFAKKVKLLFAGNTAPLVFEHIHRIGLDSITKDLGFIPMDQAQRVILQSSLLLLIQNKVEQNIKGRIPAKVFEYMATGKPILMLGDPHSDLADLLSNYPKSHIADFDDQQRMELAITEVFNNQDTDVPKTYDSTYSRRACAEQFNDLLISLFDSEPSNLK